MSNTVGIKSFDPLQVAMAMTVAPKNLSTNEKPHENPPKISEIQQQVWASGGDSTLDMSLPIDAWNTLHYRCYFARMFKKIYGHMYPGKLRIDNMDIGAMLIAARQELELNNSEIVDFIDWAAKNRMPMIKSYGMIYTTKNLREDLKEYYQQVISIKKIADSTSRILMRDLVIDPKDLRIAMHKYMQRNTDSCVVDFDNRLLTQFGIAMVAYYLQVQEEMEFEAVSKLILSKIDSIIREDLSRNSTAIAPRFEKIIKASIAWEPYPWKAINWRESALKNAIEFFKLNEQPWWKDTPTAKRNYANCLKIFKAKKKDF